MVILIAFAAFSNFKPITFIDLLFFDVALLFGTRDKPARQRNTRLSPRDISIAVAAVGVVIVVWLWIIWVVSVGGKMPWELP